VRKIKLNTPIERDELKQLEAGDMVFVSGEIFTARDAVHHLIVCEGEIPIDLNDRIIYYAGPAPAPPGHPIGSIGPTTSSRMDVYTEEILKVGVAVTIGKGPRSDDVKPIYAKYGALHLSALGGVGALLATKVKSAEVVAFSHLGPEAVYRLVVEDFPAIVSIPAK